MVTRKGKVVGIVMERGQVRKVLAKNGDPNKIKLEEIMSQPVITISPSPQQILLDILRNRRVMLILSSTHWQGRSRDLTDNNHKII